METCPACAKPWDEHAGILALCQELAALREEHRQLRELVASLERLSADSVAR